ncbi:MAG: ATP-binding cassette domain-containing protein, partial [Mesorhizobium sp.]
MGAGKSTVVNIISGRLQPDEGFLELDSNTRLTGISVRAAQASGIETVHQHLALCNKLSAAENIFLGREPVRFSLGPLR